MERSYGLSPSSAGAPLRVLVVDDDELVRGVVELALLDSDIVSCEVVAAPDGQAALEMIRGGAEFDVILTDMNMPNLDGRGLYQAAVNEFPHLRPRFLFMTGGVDPRVQQFLRTTATNQTVLPKPFEIGQLCRMVRRTGRVAVSPHRQNELPPSK